MKLEYLPDGSPDCPLIRLYDFTPIEAQKFLGFVEALSRGAMEKIALHELPDISPIGDCRLALSVQSWDQGVIAGKEGFDCGLTAGTCDNFAGLVEPFAHGSAGFQWLAGIPGEIALLISADGAW